MRITVVSNRAAFSGDVAGYYQQFRRGYPKAVVDAITATFGLGHSDVAIDIGCGTGQLPLPLPLARRVGVMLGVDPEPDMLARARAAGRDARLSNLVWALGSDTDLPPLGELLAGRPAEG